MRPRLPVGAGLILSSVFCLLFSVFVFIYPAAGIAGKMPNTMPVTPAPERLPVPSDWDRVAANDEFKDLLAAKARFIVPACLFFMTYYFALPVLVGYAREFMSQPVIGPVNLAYLFALSQFFMAWTIAWLYMRAAARFDEAGKRVLEHLALQKESDSQAEQAKPAPKGQL